MTETIDLETAIEQAIDSGIQLNGWTVRMTCDDTRFRDPRSELRSRVLDLFSERFTDQQNDVIDVEGKGVFAVFDGYLICGVEELKDSINGFDTALNEILDDYPRDEGERHRVGLNIGFLAPGGENGHVHGPDCDH